MDAIRRAAFVSVSRACGFCALGFFCVMLGFAHDPQRSAQAGSLLFFALALGLIWKAQLALRTNYKKTETWLMLAPEDRPSKDTAQTVLSVILRDVYLLHARYCAIAAGSPFACSIDSIPVAAAMMQRHPVATAATPLRSLTAIALDTETTSLDVHHARVLEIGAIAILKGRLVPELSFRLSDQSASGNSAGIHRNPWHYR